jgi:hypothetical protein
VARPRMTRWYSLPRLLSIGIRAAVSTVFGEFADRRSTMAAERALNPAALDPELDYRGFGNADFWFDFAADTGDGWDSTYAIARLLANPQLTVDEENKHLPRGRFLILGGDQVYPTPSHQDYLDKFLAPFDAAHRINPWPRESAPDLYAIPGNHDWYDGLAAFLDLFCWRQLPGPWSVARKGRTIGGRNTRQTRSYFALALPHNWWVWGFDAQLTLYIDQQQINFFSHVAGEWMAPGSRLILCVAQPDWAYVDPAKSSRDFEHFTYLERLADLAGKGHRLCAILTGDSHHYSRYVEQERHYITAGGAGAFLHPTHQLRDKLVPYKWSAPGSALEPALDPGETAPQLHTREFRLARDSAGEARTFPPQKDSRAVTRRNVLFAFYNWDYMLVLGGTSAMFAWLLHTNALIDGTSLPNALREPTNFVEALISYFGLVISSPWPPLLVVAACVGYGYFSAYPFPYRLITGLLHALAQTGAVVLVSLVCARSIVGAGYTPILIVYIGVAGGIVAATVMGLYLLISLNCFSVHWNEAFSSLRIRDYKCFLRFRIAPNGDLTIYPIGLRNVPADHGEKLYNPTLNPRLIEPAIKIKAVAASIDDAARDQ